MNSSAAASPSWQALLTRLDHLPSEFRDGVQKAILVADVDPEMALTRSRKVLELVVREVYERQIKEPPGTRPLENLIKRLVVEGFFPQRIGAFADAVRVLGNAGTHALGEHYTASDVQQSLTQLLEILRWHVEEERAGAVSPKRPELAQTTPARTAVVSSIRSAIVPKGLRSFDANDADFFLDLLPGPRDRDGLPESIRFWKHRIEETHELTFTMGVIYGPSGCGKSSLVKAGLLPRLASNVLSVYVEATAADTEARLFKGLRKRCSNMSEDLDLTGTLAALCQGKGLSKGQKVFVVLDQFEQWLHAKRAEENPELVQALRQCDGEHVQCVVLVRDDFWIALSRFMGDLSIDLLQGQNAALVDLFDLRHARKVLSAFGQAFGALSESPAANQEEFLTQAVEELAQDGRVISVRLALFAEMVKGKAWTPATMKEVGGTQGVGVTFLEETFSNPKNRPFQKAARAVLKALLPEHGSDIKGNMQSHDKLLIVSEYGRRPKEFEELLRLLDSEVRLITPTDPTGTNSEKTPATGEQYYQLTHDYLVPSLRGWLTRKQKETRRGRAELRLADRAELWNAKPERRQLPDWVEMATILLFTRSKGWTVPQRKMMRRAIWYWVNTAIIGCVVGVALGLLLRWGIRERDGSRQGAGLIEALLSAEIRDVPRLVESLRDYREWTDPKLRDVSSGPKSAKGGATQLRASLALLPVDSGQVDYLYGRLLDAEPQEVIVIRDALYDHRGKLIDRLWPVVQQPDKGKEGQRLRAACALARYDPDNPLWKQWSGPVVDQLVSVSSVHLNLWMAGLRPVRDQLQEALIGVFGDRQRRETERSLATDILADYAADQPDTLADLLMDADEKQFAVIFPKFHAQGERALPIVSDEINRSLPPDAKDNVKEKLAKRQANAAAALLKMSQPEKVWPLLKRTPPDDPRLRSYLIHRFGPLKVDVSAIVGRFEEEADVTIRRALILSLGEFGEEGLPSAERGKLVTKMQEVYRTADDPGEHAAAEWLLRRWKQEQWLRQTEDAWAKDIEHHEKRLANKDKVAPQWYVNGQGQTMVVLPEAGVFWMGSPDTEEGRAAAEVRHKTRIGRTFAFSAKPVTLAQFEKYYRAAYKQRYDAKERYTPADQCPVNYTSWYQAAAYCNWLNKEEGIEEEQWCYEVDGNGQVTKLKAKYLSLTGYRLPTEAEMEYATRAGALTSRYYGETEELLPQYARYLKNSEDHAWPVGHRKPNDFGLFDLHGNVWNWCQERYEDHLKSTEVSSDTEDEALVIDPTVSRVLRGGSFGLSAWVVRCAYRVRNAPTNRGLNVGFRAARTFR